MSSDGWVASWMNEWVDGWEKKHSSRSRSRSGEPLIKGKQNIFLSIGTLQMRNVYGFFQTTYD